MKFNDKNRLSFRSLLILLVVIFGSQAATESWAGPTRVRVIKKIACVPAGADCSAVDGSAYRGMKTGFKNQTQLPGFCYQITITNVTDFTAIGIQITDDSLDLSGCNFPTTLAPHGAATCYVLTEHDASVTNTVTVIAAKEGTTLLGTNQTTAVARVLPVSLSCTALVSSPDDLDGVANNSNVILPADALSHSVTYSVIVANTGSADLRAVKINDPLLVAHGCTIPPPFVLLAGASTNITLCTIQLTCDELPLDNTITVTSKVKPDSAECATDINGQVITATSQCSASVDCGCATTCSVGGPDPVCIGSTNTYTSAATAGATHSWSVSGGGTIVGVATNASVDVAATAAGSFTVTDSVSLNGCPGSCSKTVTVSPQAGLSCVKLVSSPDDLDGNPNDDFVLLPTDGNAHDVTYSVQVTAGPVALNNVTIRDAALALSLCTLPDPFSLPANTVTNFTLCTVPLSCNGVTTPCNTFPTLGAANGFGVLALGGNTFKMSGPKTLVNSSVGIGPNATGQFDAGQVTGEIIVDPSGTLSKVNVPNGGIVVSNLSQAVADALQASADAAALAPTQTFSDILVSQTIVGNGGINVIKVNNKFTLSTKKLTLQGGPSDQFIFNILGQFKFDGGSKVILQGGVLPSNVLFNIIGTGDAVKISGGLDGNGIPKTQLIGTVLAPQRTVSFTGSMITGALISGMNIHMDSGARLICSGGISPPPPRVNTVTVTADSICGPVSSSPCEATVGCQAP